MKQAIIYTLIAILVIFCLASCGPSDRQQADIRHSDTMIETAEAEENGPKEENGQEDGQKGENDMADAENAAEGTRVKVTMNDKTVYAVINNTVIARAFLEKLPFRVDGFRSTSDICCSVTDELPNDPDENRAWHIGEIGWFGGWFTILCADEEQFTSPNFAIIGKFEDEYIDTVTSLTGSIQITVERVEEESGTANSESEVRTMYTPNEPSEE